jgi:hypothetical protein
MSERDEKLQSGDRVHHWFAGTGTVRWAKRKNASVLWDKGGSGIALVEHCRLQARKRQRTPLSAATP